MLSKKAIKAIIQINRTINYAIYGDKTGLYFTPYKNDIKLRRLIKKVCRTQTREQVFAIYIFKKNLRYFTIQDDRNMGWVEDITPQVEELIQHIKKRRKVSNEKV